MAKAENTRRAYRAAVRAWCAWCARHDLPPLPACGQDVAAFLAGERGRKLSPERSNCVGRRSATCTAHPAARCQPTTCAVPRHWPVSAGKLPVKARSPQKGGRDSDHPAPAAGARGLRDRAVLLVGFTGALRRSEPATIRFEQLEKTDRGTPAHPGADQMRADRRGHGPCPAAIPSSAPPVLSNCGSRRPA